MAAAPTCMEATVLEFLRGDLFASGADVLCNAVNTEGIMGKGIALEFKRRWPAMYESYKRACVTGQLVRERLHVWTDPDGQIIVNLVTKFGWRANSRPEYISAALVALRRYLVRVSNTGLSVAVPALGCGLGGLPWVSVRNLISVYLDELPNKIYVYEPQV